MDLNKLLQNYLEELDLVKRSTTPLIFRAHACIKLCKEVLSTLRNEIAENGFNNLSEEIHFFKNIKPIPLSKLIYFSELATLDYHLSKISTCQQKKLIKLQLKKTHQFFIRNIDFGQYIEMKYTHLDEHYFTRKSNTFCAFHNFSICDIDADFSTPKDNLLAHFKAYGELTSYLRKKLNTLSSTAPETITQQHSLKWIGNKIDLIELIYAIHASGAIKSGTGIKEVAEACEELFEINLGNYYRKFLELRNRKLVERTRFIDYLKESLIQKMEKADE